MGSSSDNDTDLQFQYFETHFIRSLHLQALDEQYLFAVGNPHL